MVQILHNIKQPSLFSKPRIISGWWTKLFDHIFAPPESSILIKTIFRPPPPPQAFLAYPHRKSRNESKGIFHDTKKQWSNLAAAKDKIIISCRNSRGTVVTFKRQSKDLSCKSSREKSISSHIFWERAHHLKEKFGPPEPIKTALFDRSIHLGSSNPTLSTEWK